MLIAASLRWKGARRASVTRRTWIGYTAALWALVFAAFHVVWAMGWYIGLDQEPAGTAFARRWFLIYDLVVAGMCAFAVPVALALFQPWGRRVPRWLLGFLAWCGTGLLTLRGVGGVVQTAYFAAVGRPLPLWTARWDAWFCLGAVLFGLSTWTYWREQRRW